MASSANSTPQFYVQASPQLTHAQVFPKELMFTQSETTDIAIKKNYCRLTPLQGNITFVPAGPNNRIQFKFPQLLFDLRNIKLEMTVTCTGPGGGVTQWMCHDIRSIFKYVRVLATNNPIEDQRDAHKVLATKTEWLSAPGVEAQVGEVWGAQPLAARQAAALAAQVYMVPIDVNLFKKGPFPVNQMDDEMMLELELAPVVEVMESSAAFTTQNYSISAVQLHTMTIESDRYRKTMEFWMAAGGIDFGFKTFMVHRTTAQTGALQVVQLPIRNLSVDAILVQFKSDTYDTNIQNLDKLLTWVRTPAGAAGTINTSQIRIFGKYWPEQPFQLTDRLAFNMYDALGQLFGHSMKSLITKADEVPTLGWTAYNTGNRFMQIFDLSYLLPDGLISAASTAGQVVDPVFEFNFTAVTGACVCDFYVLYYRTCKLASIAPGSTRGRWEIPKY